MKKILSILGMVVSFGMASAQIHAPVKWQYGLKKLTGNTYEVHLQATIEEGWHIYAQKQSEDAIAVPTKIKLEKVAGLKLLGIPAELGKKESYTVPEAGITNLEYANKVDFVQKVTLTAGVKEIKGTVNWQSCTHEMCLQEQSLAFIIPVVN